MQPLALPKEGRNPIGFRDPRGEGDEVAHFMRLSGMYALLTKAEEQELALTLRQYGRSHPKGKAAHDRLTLANLRLVIAIAKKHQNRGLPFIELLMWGTVGLLKAVPKFDPDTDYKFSTYSYWWIRQEIGRALMNSASLIRKPCHIHEKRLRIQSAIAEKSRVAGQTLRLEDVVDEVELEAAQIRQIFALFRPVDSLDRSIRRHDDKDADETLMMFVDSADEYSAERSEQRLMIDQLLGKLPEMEAKVVRLRWLEGYTHQEIADSLGFANWHKAKRLCDKGMMLLRRLAI